MAKNIRVKNKKEKYETICIVLLFVQAMAVASCIAIMIYETMFSTFSIEGLAAGIVITIALLSIGLSTARLIKPN